MFDETNRVSNLSLNFTFRSWMLLSLLQLSPKRWSELRKDTQRRLPHNQAEYVQLQQTILREKPWRAAFGTRQGARNAPGSGSSSRHFAIEHELRPLFMCLGDPGGCGVGSNGLGAGSLDREVDHQVDVHDEHYLCDSDGGSDVSSDEEQWAYEDLHDALNSAELDELRRMSPGQVADLYWAMRRVVRRFRAARGRFGPRGRFKGGCFKRRFRKGSSKGSGGKRRKGFYVGGNLGVPYRRRI